MKYKVELAAQVVAFHGTLGMGYRRSVKQALRQLAAGKGDTHPLHDALEGYHRLRIGPYRIIYRHEAPRRILCDYMGARSIVYEVFEAEIIRRLAGRAEIENTGGG
jgi:mRNA-degrading endonuclease RelE of RelBE toxin-antitoxin system